MSGRNTFYVQCVFVKDTHRTTAWVPETFATPGRTVRFKDEGTWGENWQVLSAGIRLPEIYLRERSRDYTQTRKASDI